MHRPSEVDALLAALLPPLPAESCALKEASGRVLREDLRADRDFPPFNRAMMDGYAVCTGQAATSLQIAGFQPAGAPARPALNSATETLEIATGAVVPACFDALIPYEQAQREGDRLLLGLEGRPERGRFIHVQGADAKAGEVLVRAGSILTGRELALAAACGATRLLVSKRPRVAIVSSGDELVAPEMPAPAPHQLRRSNDLALAADLALAGHPGAECFAVRDHHTDLAALLSDLLLRFDVVLATGGISKGRLDLVPGVLQELGVTLEVRGVTQKPGKPFAFGLSREGKPVFLLPGNPAAAYVCFHRYVLPALRRQAGQNPRPPLKVRLASPVEAKTPLTLLVPARLSMAPSGHWEALAAPVNNSGDFVGLVGTDGFIEIAPGEPASQASFYPWTAAFFP